MVSFVSSRRTLCGRILSFPSRSSSLMDVDFANIKIHANMFRRGLGHGIHAGKTIILLWALAHPRGPKCHRGCGIRCLASSVPKGLWSLCQSNCLQSCSALSNIHHSLLLRARHGIKWNFFSSSVSIQVVMCCK